MIVEIEGIKFYTILDVAEVLRVTPQTVRKYIKEGKLRGQKIGRPTYVTFKSLQEYLNAPEAQTANR